MSLSLNDMIKKIVESEKEKNKSINELKVHLQREYEKFISSKSNEKIQILQQIDNECNRILEEAREKATSIITSAEKRKDNIKSYYEKLKSRDNEIAKKVSELLFR